MTSTKKRLSHYGELHLHIEKSFLMVSATTQHLAVMVSVNVGLERLNYAFKRETSLAFLELIGTQKSTEKVFC